MPSQSAIDGLERSLWSKWFNRPRRRNTERSKKKDDYIVNEIPMSAVGRSAEGELKTCDSTDFEELKLRRRQKMKSKVLNCLQALRPALAKEDEKLVDVLFEGGLK